MRRVLLAATAAIVLVTGGCGIPDQTRVKEMGPGLAGGVAPGEDSEPPRIRREATSDRNTFIEYYLQVAAGAQESAPDRVKEFLTPDAAETFKAGVAGLRVVRLVERPLVNAGVDAATVKLQHIGTLNIHGVLEPSAETEPVEYPISVGTLPNQSGLFVKKPLPGLFISVEALRAFYEQRTVYFWNSGNTGLVPDVRYMPRSTPAELRPTTVVKWLLEGPAPWLEDAVQPLAPDAQLVGSSVPAASNGTLQVSLSPQAVPAKDPEAAAERLARQLRWSLGPVMSDTLALKIGNQEPVEYSGTEYLTSNAANRLVTDPERFLLYGGRIFRMAESSSEAAPIPVLQPEANRNIRAAALSATEIYSFAAVVTAGQRGTLQVAVARNGSRTPLQPVPGVPAVTGQPAWAITATGSQGAVGLVPTAGGLYSFSPDGSQAAPVALPGVSAPVTAVAVAPDGHRIAVVAGGVLYRAVLVLSGKSVELGTPERLWLPIVRSVTAVDFSSEGWLTVAGVRAADNRSTILDVTVDGALSRDRLADIGTETVSYLTAYPASPIEGAETSALVSYQTANGAFDALSTPFPLEFGQLAGQPGRQQPNTVPAAPFFLR